MPNVIMLSVIMLSVLMLNLILPKVSELGGIMMDPLPEYHHAECHCADVIARDHCAKLTRENTKGGSITVSLTSCLTGLD
jgi:hypothetical protein